MADHILEGTYLVTFIKRTSGVVLRHEYRRFMYSVYPSSGYGG
ncbi:hypothetical protein PoMZ_12749 [Pyricularia oryzae]|uniref:Uncharacterized protein n=1 Tax=Pyricularia oryzae TaxID=318829 RepID=A0A4P7NTE4_PYROR|nr:hypothetical protein PoMZ_12749 [Pyricularia oryzae]